MAAIANGDVGVRVEVGKSKHEGAGRGVFATQDIAAGSVLAVYPGTITTVHMDKNPYLVRLEDGRFLDGTPDEVGGASHWSCIGNLINHANPPLRPNGMFCMVSIPPDSTFPVIPDTASVLAIVATRPLSTGEEILIDYSLLCLSGSLPDWYSKNSVKF